VTTATPRDAARALEARAEREQADLARRALELEGRVEEVARHLCVRFGARRVFLFGSLAWGGFHASSDVDLAVEGIAPDRLCEAATEASAAAERVVELFALEELPPSFRERITSEGRRLA